MQQLLERMTQYFGSGGAVMIPLTLVGLLLWFMLGLRSFVLRRGFSEPIERAIAHIRGGGSAPQGAGVVAEALRRARRVGTPTQCCNFAVAIKQLTQSLNAFRRAIRVFVTIAPLLGLLGTVIGMIETFASLQQQALFAQSGGIAGGISAALITTQMGLLVAIPGLVMARWLDRKEQRSADELAQIAVSFGGTNR